MRWERSAGGRLGRRAPQRVCRGWMRQGHGGVQWRSRVERASLGHLRRGARSLAEAGSTLADPDPQGQPLGASRLRVCKRPLVVLRTPQAAAARPRTGMLCILFTHRGGFTAFQTACCVERRRVPACNWLLLAALNARERTPRRAKREYEWLQVGQSTAQPAQRSNFSRLCCAEGCHAPVLELS
jgi:hypothetical protein